MFYKISNQNLYVKFSMSGKRNNIIWNSVPSLSSSCNLMQSLSSSMMRKKGVNCVAATWNLSLSLGTDLKFITILGRMLEITLATSVSPGSKDILKKFSVTFWKTVGK